MSQKNKTLVILSPAFTLKSGDKWLPSQAAFVLAMNKHHPDLEVIILAFHYPEEAEKYHTWNGSTVITFNGGMKGKLHSLLLWMKVWRELKQLKKTHNLIGILSFFCSESAFLGHYFAKRYNLIHRIWILGQEAKKSNAKQVRRINPAPGELLAISDFIAHEFDKNHSIKPAHIIPIGIDTGSFPPANGGRTIDLLGAGNLGEIKRYDIFIDVVKIISETLPGVNSVICGGGDKQPLEQQIKNLSLENNVRLAGSMLHTDMLYMMQQCRVFLHTSSYEGFSMACGEALYAGAHVISFCKPMDADIEHWHIVHTKEEMAAKAMELLQDSQLVHAPVLTYDMNQVVDNILALYNYTGA